MATKNDKEEWLRAIASKSGVSEERVNEILASNRISPTPVIPKPKRLTIQHIIFSGVKKGIPDMPGEMKFEFDWDNLTPGIWAMLTEKNLRGKSSIIEVVRWMLRGRPSNNLQEDVRSWISKCTLCFSLDDTVYEVRIHLGDDLTGELIRITTSGQELKCASISGESEFEAVMSDFFLRELSLDIIVVGKNDGTSVIHSWPALSGVLFIGIDYSTLLGDIPPASGITVPLMQMYLGLPWVSTYTSAQAALHGLKHEYDIKTKNNEKAKKERKLRIDSLQNELEEKRVELLKTPTDKEIRDSLNRLSTLYAKGKVTEREILDRHERILQTITVAEIAYANDRRELQSFIDAEAAGAVFKKLDPVFCPRCDHRISEERKRLEVSYHNCSICGESINPDEDTERIKDQLSERVEASKAALESLQSDYAKTEKELNNIRQYLEETNRQIDSLSEKVETFDARKTLEIDIARLEARLEEVGLDDNYEDIPSEELKILSIIVEETKQRARVHQTELLADISKAMLLYGRQFGISNLTSLDLKGNGTLSLIKGGKSTNYSKVTEGEKLRLKVAAVLAMIKVAEIREVGRHPGLLMVDSPGSREITPEDLTQLIIGLKEITGELKHLQVFVAAIASPAITATIPEQRTRCTYGDNTLW